MRLMFSGDSRVKAMQADWQQRRALCRGGISGRMRQARRGGCRDQCSWWRSCPRSVPEFAALWRDNDVAGHAEGIKRLHHPEIGLIELEFSTFAVEGRMDLGMIVYNPATADAATKVRSLVAARGRAGS